VEENYPTFQDLLEQQGHSLPTYFQREFEDYLKCGRLENGFLRVRCASCHFERLVAFSCKRRALCPSCGARRMAESAALLVDEVFPNRPVRQWVLSVPFPLRFLFANHPAIHGSGALSILYSTLFWSLIDLSQDPLPPSGVQLKPVRGIAVNEAFATSRS
jgi:ribosomal protein S27E